MVLAQRRLAMELQRVEHDAMACTTMAGHNAHHTTFPISSTGRNTTAGGCIHNRAATTTPTSFRPSGASARRTNKQRRQHRSYDQRPCTIGTQPHPSN